jgi:7-carboxy-7-deazaguanine synthase
MKGSQDQAKLLVHEIFLSIEGETVTAGFPAAFVRLAGCNLACSWCDTPESRKGGVRMNVDAVVKKVARLGVVHHVTLTGGEPLLQGNSILLIRKLLAAGRSVQVETNGSIPLDTVPPHARIIADVKTPSSGCVGSFILRNIEFLKASDEVKFVIAGREDYRFAKKFIEKYLADSAAVVNLSPVTGRMRPDELARLVLKDGLRCRLNLQLHAIIWPGGEPGDL